MRKKSTGPKAKANQAAFLEAYAKTATITHAATIAGIDPTRHYEWLEQDTSYADRFKDAKAKATDALEKEARRRAIEGVEEPVGWYQGQPGGYVMRYSDTLLIFLLKGANPRKYRENFSHEITGAEGRPIVVSVRLVDAEDGD